VPYYDLQGDDEGPVPVMKVLLEKKEGAIENQRLWKRLLVEDEPSEVTYEPPVKLDMKRYIHEMLGPQGINESLVDKSMFGIPEIFPNMTKEMVNDFVKHGVLQEEEDGKGGREVAPPFRKKQEEKGKVEEDRGKEDDEFYGIPRPI